MPRKVDTGVKMARNYLVECKHYDRYEPHYNHGKTVIVFGIAEIIHEIRRKPLDIEYIVHSIIPYLLVNIPLISSLFLWTALNSASMLTLLSWFRTLGYT